MRTIITYIIICGLAAIVPFLPVHPTSKAATAVFPGWPEYFAGVRLLRLPLSEREEHFAKGFPGQIARFTDGRHEMILRWITDASRKVHPASDCFKGLGYAITPLPVWIDPQGNRWGHFEAAKTERLQVLERIYDDAGNSWMDVSTWYWAAMLGKTDGPWWAMTIAAQQ